MKKCLIALLFCITPASYAEFVLYDYFHPVGPSESLVVRFDHSIEATTLSQYKGYISLQMNGWGYNNPSETFDSFYAFRNNLPVAKQGLGIAFDGSTVLNGTQTLYEKNMLNNTDVANIYNSLWRIVYNDSVGLYDGINVNGAPEYENNHTYEMVLFINSSTERTLNFGFLDGGLADNSGEIQISITQVAIGAVPEPGSSILMGTAITLGLLLCRRRNRALQ